MTQNKNLSTNCIPCFHNVVLITFKISLLFSDKLPNWCNIAAVVITAILAVIVLFKSEINGNETLLEIMSIPKLLWKWP